MSENDGGTALDAQDFQRLIQGMSEQEIAIVANLFSDLRKLGAGISSAAVAKLAKTYADKARQLAGDGGE